MRTFLLLAAVLLAGTGCADVDGSAAPRAASTPSATSTPSAADPSPVAESSPTGKREGVVVDHTSVAGVRLGTPAAEAERRLTAALGRPRKLALPGCNGERGFWLSWETLTVLLSDEYGDEYGTESSDAVVLAGWTVIGGTSKHKLALPYDVLPGTPMRDVLTRVPGAKGNPGEGATEGQYLVHTEQTPDLLWLSGSFDDSGVVDEVTFRNATCD